MTLSQKASQLRESIKILAPNRTNYLPDENLLIKVSKQGLEYPSYWLEIEAITNNDWLFFSYRAQKSQDASIEDVAQGRLINQADGFKIQGLIITQPLGILTPEEAGAMLLHQLDEVSGLSVEEATWKLTGNK